MLPEPSHKMLAPTWASAGKWMPRTPMGPRRGVSVAQSLLLQRDSAPPTPAAGAGKARVRELPASEIHYAVREAVESTLRSEERVLGLPPLTVKWFAPEDELDVEERLAHVAKTGREPWKTVYPKDGSPGFVTTIEPNTIFLRATRSVKDAVCVLAHEVRHLWQAKEYGDSRTIADRHYGGDIDAAKEWEEADAHAYARELIDYIGWTDYVYGQSN